MPAVFPVMECPNLRPRIILARPAVPALAP